MRVIINNENLINQSSQQEAEQQLEDAINKFKENNPDLPKPELIKTLFNRFLTEYVNDRGGLLELIKSSKPVLNIFTKNPNHLKWAEEIAKAFLDGCVNQPVAGWSEISAWASVAIAPEMADKIEATKHLRTLGAIKEYILNLPQDQKIDRVIEVEAGNTLLIKIHNKLLENGEINKPWLGVPKSIAYAATINLWLNDARIDQVYNEVIETLSQTPKQLKDYLCEGVQRENWAQIAFPDQVEKIKNDFQIEINFLEDAIGAKNHQTDLNLDNYQGQKPLIEKYFKEDGSIKDLSELQALQNNLPSMREQAIATEVSKLTPEAINSFNERRNQALSTLNAKRGIEGNDFNQVLSNTEATNNEPTREVVDVTSCSPLINSLRSLNPFRGR